MSHARVTSGAVSRDIPRPGVSGNVLLHYDPHHRVQPIPVLGALDKRIFADIDSVRDLVAFTGLLSKTVNELANRNLAW